MLLNVVRTAEVFVDDVEGLRPLSLVSVYGTKIRVMGWGKCFLGVLLA
jgi:hypothetical protein